MIEKYPIDLNDWLHRLEKDSNNFVDGIPIFDSMQRFSNYRFFHYSRIQDRTVFPTMVAMYGLACFNNYVEKNDREYLVTAKRMLLWLEEEIISNELSPLNAKFFMPTYYLEPPWPNAMTLGLYLSLASRLSHNKMAIDCVIKAMFVPVSEGGVLRLIGGEAWLEEYPSTEGSFVFNGHNFGVIGLFEIQNFMTSEQFDVFTSALASTFKAINQITINGGWTYYDLNKKTFSTPSYQRIHIEQVKFLKDVAAETFLPRLEGASKSIECWEKGSYSSIPFRSKAMVWVGRISRLIKRFFYASLCSVK